MSMRNAPDPFRKAKPANELATSPAFVLVSEEMGRLEEKEQKWILLKFLRGGGFRDEATHYSFIIRFITSFLKLKDYSKDGATRCFSAERILCFMVEVGGLSSRQRVP